MQIRSEALPVNCHIGGKLGSRVGPLDLVVVISNIWHRTSSMQLDKIGPKNLCLPPVTFRPDERGLDNLMSVFSPEDLK